jgi:hypothetical protein
VAPEGGGDAGAPVELVLYIAPNSAACARARSNLESALDAYDRGRIRVTVHDVSRDVEEAERDRIVFTPTLLLRGEVGGCVVGDLTLGDALDALLSLGGLERIR